MRRRCARWKRYVTVPQTVWPFLLSPRRRWRLNMGEVVDLSEQKFLRALNTAMKFFVVEYTLGEDSTSIRTLERVLRDNYTKIRNGVRKDYLPVGVFKSHEDALRFSLHFQTDVAPQAQL